MKRMILAMLAIAMWSCTSKREFIRTENQWINLKFDDRNTSLTPTPCTEFEEVDFKNPSCLSQEIEKSKKRNTAEQINIAPAKKINHFISIPEKVKKVLSSNKIRIHKAVNNEPISKNKWGIILVTLSGALLGAFLLFLALYVISLSILSGILFLFCLILGAKFIFTE